MISTVAGSGGVPGYSGDGAVPARAQLRSPACVLVGPGDVLYICDKGNHVIRRVAQNTITTVAGVPGIPGFTSDGVATAVPLNEPEDMALLPDGRIVIADERNNRLRVLDLGANTLATIAGIGPAGFAGENVPAASATLARPFGVAVDGAGRVLVAERDANRIRAIANGIVTTVAGDGIARFGGDGGLALDATFRDVKGAAADASGTLYVSDDGNERMRKVDPATHAVATIAGNGTTTFGVDGVPGIAVGIDVPSDVIVDAAGNVLIADTEHDRVRRVDRSGIISTIAGNGTPGFSGDGGPANAAQVNRPTGLAFDGAGSLYIADFANNRIRRITEAGTIETVVGTGAAGYNGDGIAAVSAALNQPIDMAFDEMGNLFVADFRNHRVRRVDALTGMITSIAGTGEAGSSDDMQPAVMASLNFPTDVVVDGQGNVLIADSRSNRIRRVTPQGMIDTVAGSRTPGDSGDGGPALEARLLVPLRLLLIPDGRIYVSCFGNHRVRVLVPPGGDPAAPPIGAVPGGSGAGTGPGAGSDGCSGSFARCVGGGGSRKTDCFLAWEAPVVPVGRRVDCRDGDPTCDRDQQPGQCTVRLRPCFNLADPRLPQCQASAIVGIRLLRPRTSGGRPGEAEAARALVEAIAGMGGGAANGRLVSFASSLSRSECGRSFDVTVALRKHGKRAGKMAFRVSASTVGRGPRWRDIDDVVVGCLPGGEHARRPSRLCIPGSRGGRGRPGARAAGARARRTRPGRGGRPDARGRPRRSRGPGGRWARYAATPRRAEIDGVRLLFPRYLQVPGMGPWAGVAMALGALTAIGRAAARRGGATCSSRRPCCPTGWRRCCSGAGWACPSPASGAAPTSTGSRARPRRPAGSRAGRCGAPRRSAWWRDALARTRRPDGGRRAVHRAARRSRPRALRARQRARRAPRARGRPGAPGWSSTSDASPTGRDSTRCSTAFRALRAAVPDALLALVGSGPLHARLERRVLADGMARSVRLAGEVAAPGDPPVDAGRRRRGAAERGRRHAERRARGARVRAPGRGDAGRRRATPPERRRGPARASDAIRPRSRTPSPSVLARRWDPARHPRPRERHDVGAQRRGDGALPRRRRGGA